MQTKLLMELYNSTDDIGYMHKAQTAARKAGEWDVFQEITYEIFAQGMFELLKVRWDVLMDLTDKMVAAHDDAEIDHLTIQRDVAEEAYNKQMNDLRFFTRDGEEE